MISNSSWTIKTPQFTFIQFSESPIWRYSRNSAFQQPFLIIPAKNDFPAILNIEK